MKKIIIMLIVNIFFVINSINEPTGIQDLYKNSYINSVLQCLINIEPMTKFILKNQDFYKDNSLSREYLNFLDKYKKSQKNVGHNFSPEDFLEKVYNLKDKVGNSIFIKNYIASPYRFLNKILKHLITKDVSKENIDYYSYPFKNIIKNRITDIFYSVSANLKNRLSLTKIIKLSSDLDKYFSNKKIVRLPKVLIIKLKHGNLDHLTLNNLNLKKYRSKYAPENQEYIYDLDSAIFYNSNKKYINFKHYIAYVKKSENWYFCNDSTIAKLNRDIKNYKDLDRVRTPYILFYKQRPNVFKSRINESEFLKKLIESGYFKEELEIYLDKNNIELKDLLKSINSNLISFNFIKTEIDRSRNIYNLIVRLMDLNYKINLFSLRTK